MLILVVNIAYYSQFKFKVSYQGTVSTHQVIDEHEIKKMPPITAEEKKKEQEEKEKEKKKEQNERIVAGVDMSTQSNSTRQGSVVYSDYMIVKYSGREIILDNKTIEEIKVFIGNIKKESPNAKVKIFVAEPTNQASATISKQIAVSRVINVRNTIRKLNFKNSNLSIELRSEIPQSKRVDNPSGFVLISIGR